MAISCARRIFLIVSGHHEPAFTVAYFATTTTGRPATRPTPVTTPAAGARPSYWSYAISSPISNHAPSGSRHLATRSRAVSFPCSCWRRILSGPPPCCRRVRSSWYSAERVLSRVTGGGGGGHPPQFGPPPPPLSLMTSPAGGPGPTSRPAPSSPAAA